MSNPNSPKTLSTWIDIATSGLPPTVQTRLKSEIEDHYASLLEKQLGAGQSQIEAETLALQQLGAADEVSKSYRDAHFSREHYSKTMWATISLLIIQTITFFGRSILSMKEHFYGFEDRINYSIKYLLPWMTITSILSIMLIVIIGHSVRTLWKERYEIEVSRIIYWLFVVGVLSSIGVVVFDSALECVAWYTNAEWGSTPLWQTVDSVLPSIENMSYTILAISLLAFVFTTWKSVYRGGNRLAQTFTLMTGGIAVVIILFNSGGIPVSDYFAARFYYLIVTPVVMGLFALFLLLPLQTFRTMSQSGRTLEAGE